MKTQNNVIEVRRELMLVVVLVIFFAHSAFTADPVSSPPAVNSTNRFSKVIDLEQEGRLTEALNLLRQQSPDAQYTNYLDKLESVLRLTRSVEYFTNRGDFESAKKLLDSSATGFQINDVGLMSALRIETVGVDEQWRKRTEEDIKAILEKADKLRHQGDFSAAGITYQQVIDTLTKDTRSFPELMIRAKTGKTNTDVLLAAGSWKQQWDTVRTGLRTIALWIILVGAVVVVISLFSLSKKIWPRRNAFRLSFADLTVAATDRDSKSQQLTQELSWQLNALRNQETGLDDPDASNDLDGTAFPNILLCRSTPIDSLPLDSSPLRLGPFSLNPLQLWALIRELFRLPCKYNLAGTIITTAKGVLISVEYDEDAKPENWQFQGAGDDARSSAVREMALRVAFKFGRLATTGNWESFKACQDAKLEIRLARCSPDRKLHLEAALAKLQDSIRLDANNWFSWFYSAIVLRKIGQNERALEHFIFLEKLLKKPSKGLQEYLKEHREFPLIVSYNRAVCLSKLDSWDSHKTAVEILSDVIAQTEVIANQSQADSKEAGDASVPNLDQIRMRDLKMLFHSALASTLVFELERNVREASGKDEAEKKHKYQDSVLHKILEQCGEIEKYRNGDTDILIHHTYTLSRAVSQNAYGRALYLLSKYPAAADALREAITLMPDFVDPYLNLATIYIKRKDDEWIRQSGDLLTQALTLSPSNQKAHFLMGKLYADPAVAKYEKATEHLAQADLFAWSYFIQARILLLQDKLKEAIDQLRQSLALKPGADFRAILYIQCILAFTRPPEVLPPPVIAAPPPNPRTVRDLLLAAQKSATLLRDKAARDHDRQRGAALLTEVTSRLGTLSGKGILEGENPGDDN